MEINTDIDICIDALCANCGSSLETTDEDSTDENVTIKLKMCEDCATELHDNAHSEGYNQGVEESNAEISEAIDAELKDFDFDKLFKQSKQAEVVANALAYINDGEPMSARFILEGLL